MDQLGEGAPLFVDAARIDLAPIYSGDLEPGESRYVNFESPSYYNVATGLVYGTMRLTMLEGDDVKLGGENGLLDVYNFEYHEGRTSRNFFTWIGSLLAGEGKQFNIYNYGNGHLNHRPDPSRSMYLRPKY